MNKIICDQCHLEFNKCDNEPKILPCLALICFKCLSEPTIGSIEKERLVDCKNCSRIHLIPNINDLPTSRITLFLNEFSEDFSLGNAESNLEIKTKLKSFSEIFYQLIREENFDIYKRYDNVICDIDVKSEQLISFIVKSCDTLKSQIKSNHDESLKFLCQMQNPTDAKDNSDNLAVKLKCLSIDQSLAIDDEHLVSIVKDANKLQQQCFELERNLKYFEESSINLEKNFLGCILNSLLDRNYTKIKNLSSILENSEKVSLDLEMAQNLLRQEILVIDKIIKINFTTFKVMQKIILLKNSIFLFLTRFYFRGLVSRHSIAYLVN
jgi:hypothetical protein